MKIKFTRPRSNKRPKSTDIVNSNDDLLTEILLRLPIKSLVRLKLVSKHWHSLITNPQFRLLRNPNPNPAMALVLPYTDDSSSSFEYVPLSSNNPTNPFPLKKLNFTKDPHGIRIIQSCNGLLLCCSDSHTPQISTRFYVYNPTTNQFSRLPKLAAGVRNSTRVFGMSLAFDPAKSPHYKVVCVRESSELESRDRTRYQIEVYSSDSGPWRKSGYPFAAVANFENGVYWNNAVHWISNGNGDSLYFNINERRVEILPMPPIPDGWDWRTNYYFGESCDHLHYIEIYGPQIQFNVYEMKRDYSQWFVKYKVDLSEVVGAYPEMIRDAFDPTDWYYYAYTVLCVVRGEEEEDSFLVLQIPGKVIGLNLVSRSFKKLYEFEGNDEDNGFLRFSGVIGFQYIESLCCV